MKRFDKPILVTRPYFPPIDEFRAGCFEELGLVENEENFREAISYTVEPQMSMVIENQTTGEIESG